MQADQQIRNYVQFVSWRRSLKQEHFQRNGFNLRLISEEQFIFK